MEIKELRQKVDRKKLRELLRDCHTNPERWAPMYELKPEYGPTAHAATSWNLCVWACARSSKDSKWPNADWHSIFCSLAAHLHGRLHGATKYVPDYGPEGRQVLVTRTLEDQEKFIGEVWRLVAKSPEDSMGAQLAATAAAAGL
jgi:hypothetical protein